MTNQQANTTIDPTDTNQSLVGNWDEEIGGDQAIDNPQDIADLRPNDVITNTAEVADEDDVQPEAATLTSTISSISAEDGVMERMEEDLDNESAEFKRELEEVGDELPTDEDLI